MDPLTATSTAAAILQLADFTGKVLSRSQELYKSAKGALVEHEELFFVTTRFNKLLTELKVGPRGHDDESSQAFRRSEIYLVVRDAANATNELLQLLNQLARVPGTSQRWKSVRQAVATLWKEDKLRNLEKRVERYREQVSLALMHDLRFVHVFTGAGDR